jgi:DNA polymerase IV (DinB-like DNA polymerase)
LKQESVSYSLPEDGNHSNRVILALDLDYFYAQCEEVRNPGLKGKPVVVCVYSGRTEDSGAVSTSNYEARNLGVKAGIPIAFAKRALKNQPNAVFLPMDKEYYQLVSDRIMEILRSKADRFERVSIDEAYLDVSSSCEGSYEKSLDLARSLKQAILNSEGLTSSVGISNSKLISKMAADESKPNGLLLVEPERVKQFLEDKPIGKLPGIGPKTEEKLASLCITKLGELANFDPDKLSRIFGKNLGPGLRLAAQGIDESTVEEKEAEQLSRIITLKRNSSTLDFKDELEPLAKDISLRLFESKKKARSIGIIAITTALRAKSRARTLELATDSSEVIFKEACALFDLFFHEEKKEIRRAGIRVSSLVSYTRKNDSPDPEVGSGSLMDYI